MPPGEEARSKVHSIMTSCDINPTGEIEFVENPLSGREQEEFVSQLRVGGLGLSTWFIASMQD